MTTSFLSTGSGRIAYDVQGDGPLVVCLPGMGDLRSVYPFLVPALVEAGYRVATMDMRGHGDSDDGFDAYDNVAAGSDALALVRHLGGPAVLIGNSMCAAGSVWAARQEPANVAGLVLIAPFMHDAKLSPLLKFTLWLALRRPFGPSFVAAYYRRSYPGRPPADLADHVARMRASFRRGDHWRSTVRTTRARLVTVDATAGDLRLPNLVVMGTRDPDFPDPTAEARAVAERMGGELLLVPGAGYYPMAEYPEVVNPAVTAFLATAHAVA